MNTKDMNQDKLAACYANEEKAKMCCRKSIRRSQRHLIVHMAIATHIFLTLFMIEVVANFFGVFTIAEFFLPLGSITVVFVSLTGILLFLAQLVHVLKKRGYGGCGCGTSYSCDTDGSPASKTTSKM